MAEDTLMLQCRNCRMKFDSKDALHTHVTKFCRESQYADVDKLKQRFKEMNEEKTDVDPFRTNMTMEEIGRFMKGDKPGSREAQISSLTLADLRHRVRDSETEFDKAKRQYIAERENEMISEVERFRQDRQVIREKRSKEESDLLELIRDLEHKRERDMQARVEREQITKALRDLEKTKLSTLEQEKRRELNKLQSEREALRLKEEELMQEAEQLRKTMEDQEAAWKQERDETLHRGAAALQVKNPESRLQIELAKERGEKVADLKLKKQTLEQEKLRIMEDLEKVKRGDLTRLRKNTSGLLAASSIAQSPKIMSDKVPEDIRRMQEKLRQDEERLEQLRKDHQATATQPLLPVDPTDRISFPEEVESMVKKAESDLPPRERARVFGHIKDNLQSPTPPAPAATSRQGPASALMVPQQTARPEIPNYWGPPQFGDAPVPRARPYDDVRRFEPTRQPQEPPPVENDEIKSLKKEMKKLQKKLENKDQDDFYQNMQGTLQAMQMRLMGMDPQMQAQPPQQPAFVEKDMMPEERALMNLSQQEAQDLRLLSTIPKDSELYKAKLEHYREVAKERAKMEAVLSQLGMERMKKNFQREMELEERKLMNEKWVEEQRRALILQKMQGTDNPRQPTYAPVGDYNPETGLVVYWDYVTGMPSRFNQVQIVYGVFERGETRMPSRLVPPVRLEPESVSGMTFRGVFAQQHDIAKLPPYPGIFLIMEIQGIGVPLGEDEDNTRANGFGWTVMNLFTPSRRLQEGVWKVPIYQQPTDQAIELSQIPTLVPVSNAYVYLRIAGAESQNQAVTSLAVIPEQEKSRYQIPPAHQRGEYPMGAPQEPVDDRVPTRMSDAQRSAPRSRGAPNPTANIGVGVSIDSLLDFVSKGVLKFSVAVQEGQKLALNDKGGNCVWTSESLSGLKGTRVSESGGTVRVPGTNIRAGPRASGNRDGPDISGASRFPGTSTNFIEINQRTNFFQNFYHVLHQNDWKDQIYVIIQIMEKVSQRVTSLGSQDGRLREVDSFVPIAWTIYQVSNPETRQLQFGSVDLLMYRPPVIVPIYDTDQLTQVDGTLKVTIYEPSAERYMQPVSRRSRGPPQDDMPAGRREPFIENLTSQFDDGKLFEKGDGVDFYVDGARFLPDNATCTKIVVKAFTSNLEKVGTPIGGLPELTSSVYSPIFGFRTEFRMQIFDPTTIVIVALQTIDKQHGEVRVLGYSALNLFLHRVRKEQPVSPTEQDYIINKGAFQIPIYCQEPYRKPPFSMASFVKLERIPCATILVRVRAAAKSDDGLRTLGVKDALPSEWQMRGIVVPPPNYEDRVYNTVHSTPTAVERYLYQERLNRPDLSVRDATKLVQQQLGYQLELSNEEMLDWIDQRLQVTPRTGMLDMKYFAEFSPKIGFRFVVDCVHNVPNNSANIVIFSLNPPGTLYQGNVSSQEVKFTTRIDWNSSVKTQCFKDGFETFRNIAFNRNLHFIIDVRSVSFSRQTPEVQNVGWTILPIFSDDGFVESGVYQLPLFKGQVPAAIVTDLASNKPWEYLVGLMGRRGGPTLLEPASVIVRLVDGMRDGHFTTPMELQRMNYSYIPPNVLSKFSYNAAALAKSEGQKRLRSIIPNQGAEEPYQKKINQGVANFLGLDHVVA